MGVALGCIGLDYDTFCGLTPEEFAAVYKAWAERRDADMQDQWERMRLQAWMAVQPHLRKGVRLTPEKLLPLPWDRNKRGAAHEEPRMTAEEQRERMRELVKRLGDELI